MEGLETFSHTFILLYFYLCCSPSINYLKVLLVIEYTTQSSLPMKSSLVFLSNSATLSPTQ